MGLISHLWSWAQIESSAIIFGTVQCRAFPDHNRAQLRPLARLGCSMVWSLISAFRAVRQPVEAGASTNCDLKAYRIRQSNQQRFVSSILPICGHL
jgi:hypothetical protein